MKHAISAPARRSAAAMAAALLGACASGPDYASDIALVRSRVEVIELGSGDGPRVAIAPAWQGRVLTSAFTEDDVPLGWLNREFIRSGASRRGMNPYGGEERLWLGPEGGRFGLYFAPGATQDLASWQTPAALDTTPWTLLAHDATSATLEHATQLTNAAGFRFELLLQREVRLLDRSALERALGALPEGVEALAYETRNTLRNASQRSWTKETGLPSLWVLSMLPPGPRATVCVPCLDGDEALLGPRVRSDYFGALDESRLRVEPAAIFLRADGAQRSKIGVPQPRALPILGAWDPDRGVLTLAMFNQPEGLLSYVDSRWDVTLDPYAGDVVNAYNDGPPAPGVPPLGPFFELESSSPALPLASGQSYMHLHRTIHLRGDRAALDQLAQRALGVSLHQLESAFR
ncbi:MAG: hypothetical protein JNM84_28245 [Planctomycetes bacterium]|nr:hypothetical protein [Planctomycetota bacterium]